MNSEKYFYITLIISIITQIVVGAIEIVSLFIKIEPKITIIRQLLILELIVQIIE
jgi:VIT1/CCC1 family predicted Fe2+/Mn2+ transporter